ncbi:hypothetical protein PQR75_02390 [Paraburkholderia fungorum]|uniref:hypothetical protein n=1 Tax=Paraburkholderia fungorum TaxID=134537 RepID=UPI0038B793DE
MIGINAYSLDAKNGHSRTLAGSNELLRILTPQKYVAAGPHLSAHNEWCVDFAFLHHLRSLRGDVT